MTGIIEIGKKIHSFYVNFAILKLESKARKICAAPYTVNALKLFDHFTVSPLVSRSEFVERQKEVFLFKSNCLSRFNEA